MFVVQAEEWNMQDQPSLSAVIEENHGITIARKSPIEVGQEG